MAATVFATPQNNCSTAVGSAGYTAGSGNLVLAAGGGTLLPPLTGGNYCRATVIQNVAAYVPNAPASTYTIFRVTAISGDNLVLGGTLEGTTDRNYAAGDVVELRVTAGTLTDLQGAVNTLQTTSVPLTQPIITITGSTLLTAANFGCMNVCSGTSANYTVTLPPPAGPPSNAGKSLALAMAPGLTKLVTIARNASDLIDGAASRVMWANEAATLFCDGTNWTKIAGKSIPMTCQMYRSSTMTVPGGGQLWNILLDAVQSNPTGLMADTTNGRITIARSGIYQFLNSSYITMSGAGTATSILGIIYWSGSLGFYHTINAAGPGSNQTFTVSGITNTAATDYWSIGAQQSSGQNATVATGATTTFFCAQELISW